MAKYPFSEVRKTWAAVAGLLGTVIVTVLADSTLRGLLPPAWVTLLGAAATVLAVFKVPNAQPAPSVVTAPADVERARAAVQAAQDHAADITQQWQGIEAAVTGAVTGAAKSLAQQALDVPLP